MSASLSIDFFKDLDQTVQVAIAEDVGDGDITAQLIDPEKTVSATVITREDGVLCGTAWVNEVFRQVDPDLAPKWFAHDGEPVSADQVLFEVTGNARGILTAERPALNFLQTLSGTASVTARYCRLIEHTEATLLDTRKTIPGLRLAQKYAVACGGAENHRIGLFDAFLIKENHIEACGSIARAIRKARETRSNVRVEVEVENLQEYREALDAGPDWIMLDNFSLDDMRTAVKTNNAVKLEASGGIESPEDLIAIAETGVDYISIGALTKHVQAMDLSLRLSD